MPVKFNNAEEKLQQALDSILPHVKWELTLFSLCSMFIGFETANEHLDHLWQVLTWLYHKTVIVKLNMSNVYGIHIYYSDHGI